MTLIKSISGIRGTIGGNPGDALTPIDAVQFAAAYGTWLKNRFPSTKLTVDVGLGIDVINLGLSTTPTVEVAVPYHKAQGGIILTASHNPKQWNAL